MEAKTAITAANANRKRIKARPELGANYVCHLIAAAGAWFDNDYGRGFRDFIPAADRDYLCRQADLLRFGDGRAGPLSKPLILLPAYLNLASEPAFGEYLGLLGRGLGGDAGPFLAKYAGQPRGLAAWLGPVDEGWLAGLAADPVVASEVQAVGDVFYRNFLAYAARVWWRLSEGLGYAAGRLNQRLAGLDLIGAWEGTTGLRFRAPGLRVILVNSLANGPDAISLAYDRAVVCSGSAAESMVASISRAAGAQILTDLVRPALPAGAAGGGPGAQICLAGPQGPMAYPVELVYRAFAGLCRFYDRVVRESLGICGAGDHARQNGFDTLYRDLQAARPGLTPAALLAAALARAAGR